MLEIDARKKKSFTRKILDAHNIALKNVFRAKGLFIHPFNKSTICRFPLMTSNSCFQILFRNVQRLKSFPISFVVLAENGIY